ncbi:hypothetical protein D3C87_517780 [compost metagenome]
MKIAQAGFDLTEISAVHWQKLIAEYGLIFEDGKDGWTWYKYADLDGTRNMVVTANNPITGEYHGGGRENEPDYASYIGIEGTYDFVVEVFEFIKEHAEYTKSENFGSRNYI